MSVTTTFVPAAARASAVPRPMPLPPPVITATAPSSWSMRRDDTEPLRSPATGGLLIGADDDEIARAQPRDVGRRLRGGARPEHRCRAGSRWRAVARLGVRDPDRAQDDP